MLLASANPNGRTSKPRTSRAEPQTMLREDGFQAPESTPPSLETNTRSTPVTVSRCVVIARTLPLRRDILCRVHDPVLSLRVQRSTGFDGEVLSNAPATSSDTGGSSVAPFRSVVSVIDCNNSARKCCPPRAKSCTHLPVGESSRRICAQALERKQAKYDMRG